LDFDGTSAGLDYHTSWFGHTDHPVRPSFPKFRTYFPSLPLRKKTHYFIEFSITGGGGVYPFSITFVLINPHFLKNILKDAQKLLIHPEM
jgi:hypothetical protein